MAIDRRPPSPHPRAGSKRGGEATMPEPGTPEFDAEARRQSLLVARSPREQEDIAFAESVSWLFDSPSDDD